MSVLFDRPYAMMNGLGNEILVVDLRGVEGAVDVQAICALAAQPQLRFDQLMAIRSAKSADVDAFVEIYNSDGSPTGACGNGSRCVAWFLTRGAARDDVAFDTIAGRVFCRREGPWLFSADMGRPRLSWREIPMRDPVADTSAVDIPLPADCAELGRPAVVSMGNPHAIFWVEDPDRFDLAAIGPEIEHHAAFPERVNVSLAKVVDRRRIVLKVWERGAGLTRACGTAACAAVVSAVRLDKCERRCRVDLPGGALAVHWREDDRVVMTGPCELESEGRIDAVLATSGGTR